MSCGPFARCLGAVALLLCSLLPSTVAARPADLAVRFEHFSGLDGLSSSRIGLMLQDQRGFLWFATDYGLNRYDGYEFKQYLHEPTDSTSIAGAYISNVVEDRQGALWIHLVIDGVTRFDPATESFQHFAHDVNDPGSIAPGSLKHMICDAQGRPWFAFHRGRLDRYDPESASFIHYEQGLRAFLGRDEVTPKTLLADDDGHVWLLTGRNELLRLHAEAAEWKAVPWRPQGNTDEKLTALKMGADHRLWAASSHGRLLEVDTRNLEVVERVIDTTDSAADLAADGAAGGVADRAAAPVITEILPSTHRQETLWLNFCTDGIGRYDWRTEQLTHFPASDAEGDLELGRATVLPSGAQTMHEDHNGTLWVALRSRGVLSHDPLTDKFRWHRYRAANPTSVGPYQVHQILEDRTGILWFATRGGGVSKFNPRQQSFSHDLYEHQFRDIIDGGSISAGVEMAEDIAWIGTVSRGFFRYDRAAEQITNRFFLRDRNGYNAIHAMVRSSSDANTLWVGSDRGLMRVDVETLEIQHYEHNPNDPHSLGDNRVHSIVEDNAGQLWVGTNHAGLEVLDLATGRFRHVPHKTSGPEGTSHGTIWAATKTRDGQLWFGVIPGGVHRYDPATERFHHYVDVSEMSGRSDFPKSVYSIFEDEAGLLWMATYSNGLVSLDRQTGALVGYTREAGLPSNRVFDILEGTDNDLWLSSDRGLTRFDRDAGVFENFDRSDGLQNDEFLPSAGWRSRRGELFFGGIDGLTSFFPSEVERNPYAPPVQVTALRVISKGGDVRSYAGVSSGDSLILDHQSNHLEVEFAALDFTNPAKNRYTYCLDGVDKKWCAAGSRRFASWSHLDPGKYVLRILGSNNHGVWSEEGFHLAVIIQPPFYRTAWFLMACIALVGAMGWTAHRLRVRAATLRIREFERLRQVEVERVRKEAARDIHDELGHLVTRISLFGEIARQLLPPSMNGGSPAEYLQRITDTSKDLAEGLGDFVWTLDPKSDSVLDVLVRLKDFGDKLFSHTGIDFQVVGLDDHLRNIHLSLPWRRNLTMMFKEAMTNVLKHSRGTIVELRAQRQGDSLQLSLADNGNGFDMQRAAQSRGHGLHNMQARAKKLGGRVQIDSQKGQGTRLSFTGHIPGDER